MKLYIYEDQKIQLVQLANVEPKGYNLKKQNVNHIVYEKEGCLDIVYLPVQNLDRAYEFLSLKLNQSILKQQYDIEHPTWITSVLNCIRVIKRWIPFLRNY